LPGVLPATPHDPALPPSGVLRSGILPHQRVDPADRPEPGAGYWQQKDQTADLADEEAALAAHSDSFFTIPHFDGYRAVLIRLP
jgi:hypothetical protein